MARVRTPIEVRPLPEPPPRAPLVAPEPGWEPSSHRFESVYLLDDGYTLEVHGVHGNWQRLHGLEVDETDRDVVVLTMALAHREKPRGGWSAHTLEGYPFRVRVRLTRPLGSRRVVDGALPTPEQARWSAIQTAVTARRRLQLPADEHEVAGLVDALAAGDPGVVRHWVDVPLTPAEYEQVMQVQREMEELLDAGHVWANEHEDVFAGAIHEWTPEVAVFLVTDGAAADELRGALAASGWTRFAVRVVRFSEAELKPLIRRSMNLLREAGFDVRGGGLDTVDNRVRVRIWDDHDPASAIRRAEKVLAEHLPPNSFVVER